MTQLTKKKREHLRQIILDCTLRRLSTTEALSYIKDKLKVSITDRYYYIVKKNIIDSTGEQLNYLMQTRNAYLSQYFERIAEQYKLQKELWEMYYEAKTEKDKRFQLDSIKEIQQVSVNLTNLYVLLPNIAGIQFQSAEGEHNDGKHIDGYSKDCKVCVQGGRHSYEEDEEAVF